MKVALPIGEMHVVMEVWRQNIYDWYEEHIDAGNIVDLAGTGESLPTAPRGRYWRTPLRDSTCHSTWSMRTPAWCQCPISRNT